MIFTTEDDIRCQTFCTWCLCLVLSITMSPVIIEGILLSGPEDTVVIEGSTVTLSCRSSTDDPVMWVTTSPLADIEDNIFHRSGTIADKFRERFSVITNDKFQNLRITNVNFQDAGVYKCIDDDGFDRGVGHLLSANLIVLESKPVAGYHNMSKQVVIAEDVCGLEIQPDYINFTCAINFRGNLPPLIKWIKHPCNCEDASIYVTNQIIPNDKVTSTALVNAKLHSDISNISCRVYFPPVGTRTTSRASNLSWTSPQFNILKLDKREAEIRNQTLPFEERCSVNINVQCSYKWRNKERSSVIHSNVLKLDEGDSDKTGRYDCTVECIIRGRVCLFEPLMVYVKCEIVTVNAINVSTMIGVCVGIFLLILTIFTIWICYRNRWICYRKRILHSTGFLKSNSQHENLLNRSQQVLSEVTPTTERQCEDQQRQPDGDTKHVSPCVVDEVNNGRLKVQSQNKSQDQSLDVVTDTSPEKSRADKSPLLQAKEEEIKIETDVVNHIPEVQPLLMTTSEVVNEQHDQNPSDQETGNKDEKEISHDISAPGPSDCKDYVKEEVRDKEKVDDVQAVPEYVVVEMKTFVKNVTLDTFEKRIEKLITCLNEKSPSINEKTLEFLIDELMIKSLTGPSQKFVECGAKTCSALCSDSRKFIEWKTFSEFFFTRLEETHIQQQKSGRTNLQSLYQFTEFVAHLVNNMKETDGSVLKRLAEMLNDLVKILMSLHNGKAITTIGLVVKMTCTVKEGQELSPFLDAIFETLCSHTAHESKDTPNSNETYQRLLQLRNSAKNRLGVRR